MTQPAPVVRVVVGSSIVVPTGALPPAAESELDRRLTFLNPEWLDAAGAGRRVDPRRTPQHLRLLRRTRAGLVAPRGAIGLLREVVVRHGGRMEVDSRVAWVPLDPLPAGSVPGAPRPYQLDGENALLARVQGQVVLPCGGGKTWLGARALVRSRQAGLVLVHTTDLLDQWAETLRGVAPRPPRIVGGRGKGGLDPLAGGEVAVATVQTLARAGREVLPFLRSAGALLVDELQHCPSETWRSVVSICPARYRWGVTATPDRPDGLGFLLPLHFGPVVLQRTAADLVAGGWLVLPRVVPVETGWAPDPAVHVRGGRPDHVASVNALSEDAARNGLVLDLAAALATAGRTALVLVARVEHADLLAYQLRQRGVEATAVHGELDARDRAARLSAARSRRVQVVVATQLADEGLDVPVLDALVLATPQRAQGRAVQRIGRIMRPAPGKAPPLVLDLVDGGHLRQQWRSREAVYRSQVGVSPDRPVGPADAVRLAGEKIFAEGFAGNR